MLDSYCILVNTTDSFEDCWLPYFKLFNQYWPTYKGKVYLNTENKAFSYEDLNIIPIKNGLIKGTWSQCLDFALGVIKEENILYLQEDYFFNDFIKDELLNEFYDKFIKLNCDCLHLTDQSTPGPFRQTKDDMVWEIEKSAPYRISCQAAFWKKDVLLSYLREHESAWHFEHYGTKRSTKKNGKFYVVNTNKFGCGKIEILPYVFTGIIKGKWNEKVKPLFSKLNIEIDYSQRGFFIPVKYKKTFLEKVQGLKINELKSRILSKLDLILNE